MYTLGNRMKDYEETSKTRLIKRMPVIIRLDGRAFHTFTRGLKKPFDKLFVSTMIATTRALFGQVQNCVFAYTQSDEITLVLVDYKKLNTSCWFDNVVQKMVSTSASLATIYFNKFFMEAYQTALFKAHDEGTISDPEFNKYINVVESKLKLCPTFDARVFNVPMDDVVNNIVWRQQDCIKNSVNAVSLSMFSHKELEGKSMGERIQMMLDREEPYYFWVETPSYLINGIALYRKDDGEIFVDLDMPDITGEGRWDYVLKHISVPTEQVDSQL